MLRFDIRHLRRLGRLDANQYFGWHWSRDGEQIANIAVQTFCDAVELNYACNTSSDYPQSVTCRVELNRTSCHYGGERSWFICPDCQRRCAVLFGVSRLRNFACRICQNLAYASEAEDPIDRCWRRQRKLEALMTEEFERPKGMHTRTYERIIDTWDAIESHKDEQVLKRLRLLESLQR